MTKRKMYIRMVTASLLRRKSRMIIAMLAIIIGATIVSGLITIYREVPKQLADEFRNYGANMIVTAAEDDYFTQEDLDAAAAVIDADDLVGATPYRYENVRINEQPITAAGTDMESAQATSPYWSIEGDWPSAEGELLVGESVAETLGADPGETLTVTYTPEDESELDREITFTVTGILSTGGNEEDYVYMYMSDLETLLETENEVDVAEFSVSGESDALSAYVDEIESEVPSLNASLVKRVTESETTVLTKLQALVLLVTIVVLALMLISVATTMTAVVSERRNEIGLRKAIGATDASLIKEFMGEGVLLGLIGGIIGYFVGYAFALGVSIKVFSSTISMAWGLLPITVVISIAVTAVAILLPIRNATRIEPALVLKGE